MVNTLDEEAKVDLYDSRRLQQHATAAPNYIHHQVNYSGASSSLDANMGLLNFSHAESSELARSSGKMGSHLSNPHLSQRLFEKAQ